MKFIATIHLFVLVSFEMAFAQNKEELSVRQPIDRLFAGMSAGDSSMVHSAFAKQVTMATIGKDKTGQPFIRNESGIADFLKAVGSPHPEPLNEPIWDVKIAIDGNFAQVWASYAFYIGKKFSHCGVDAFHLYKQPDGQWKIFHLADTRQKEGCSIPQEVSDRFK
ncbi:MAG: hypothetical protein ACK5RG_14815 [Cyclobacteriaceae bacterium]|jgi:hypothetical protein|nr:nuclear transport factor 2 family protein [Flammeovirgaceae bacterium]